MKIIKTASYNKISQQSNILSRKERDAINTAFVKAGLDGNKRDFKRPGEILRAISSVLNNFSLELLDIQSHDSFPERIDNSISRDLRVGRIVQGRDPFTPGIEIENSHAHVTYQMIGKDQEGFPRYDAIAYMT